MEKWIDRRQFNVGGAAAAAMLAAGGTRALAQPAPLKVQITIWLFDPVTFAVKRASSSSAIAIFAGCTLTTTCGRIVTLADALAAPGAWLTAVRVTGFGNGTPAGAT